MHDMCLLFDEQCVNHNAESKIHERNASIENE